jgi:primosomal protein N' (replication factor Y)
VVTDVAAVDKEFAYLVPPALAPVIAVGTQVRVDLGGRRVGGWVVGLGVESEPGLPLRPISKVRGWGPEAELVELANWAAWRWAGRRGVLLATASAERAVPVLPAPARQRPAPPPPTGLTAALPVERPLTLRLPPSADVTPLVAEVAQRGPTLVVVPSLRRGAVLAERLRRAGGDVAVMPADWAHARAGAAVVVGSRTAAWAPCPGLSAVVVVDGHDQRLIETRAPTWGAVTVAAERARRAGVPCVVVSACPTAELLAAAPVRLVDRRRERQGWAPLEVVDRRPEDPRLGLYSEQLVALIRTQRRVACVLNRTGRARLLVCASCGEVTRCERCGGALAQHSTGQSSTAQSSTNSEADRLICPRCGLGRPHVCAGCGSSRLRLLRVGVTRAREELEALAGRPVGEVTAATGRLPETDLFVGTEAVLHRLSPRDHIDAVALVELDQELLAPRVSAGEEALALLALASRLVGGRSGRVLAQTRLPDHPAVRAALLADPGLLTEAEHGVRAALRLPPVSAVALVSGPSAAAYVEGLRATELEVLGPDRGEWLIKAPDAVTLADTLAGVARPPGRLRVAVSPARY